MKLKVILEASMIPIGETVTKVNGTNEYVLKDSIVIYKEGGAPKQEIKADGCFFLVNERSINAIPGDRELLWTVDRERLIQYFHDQESHQ